MKEKGGNGRRPSSDREMIQDKRTSKEEVIKNTNVGDGSSARQKTST